MKSHYTRNILIALSLSGLAHIMFLFVNNEAAHEVAKRKTTQIELLLVESNPEVIQSVEKPAQHEGENHKELSEDKPSEISHKKEQIKQADVIKTIEDKKSPLVADFQQIHETENLDEKELLTEQVVKNKEQLITQQVEQQIAQQAVNYQQQADDLSLHIYRAINKNKQYPYRARRLNKQGNVKLSFVMHPDGLVSDVTVLESSYHKILDSAAQRAVSSISPFAMAAQYLNYKHQYNIDIEFRLN